MNAQQLIDRVRREIEDRYAPSWMDDAEILGEWAAEDPEGFRAAQERDDRVAVTLEEAEDLAAEGFFG